MQSNHGLQLPAVQGSLCPETDCLGAVKFSNNIFENGKLRTNFEVGKLEALTKVKPDCQPSTA